jgi:hypothetical protein
MHSQVKRLVTVLAVGILVTVGGCSGSDDQTDSANTPQASTEVPPPPEVGQCRNPSAAKVRILLTGANVSADDTTPVDCSQPHTLETFAVVEVEDDLDHATGNELAPNCPNPIEYVGTPDPANGAYRVAYPIVTKPSREQQAGGQSWIRCDIGVPAKTRRWFPLEAQTESLRNSLPEGQAHIQMCIDQLPDPNRSLPLTSCEEAHRAELLPTRLELYAADYPTDAELRQEGQEGCKRLISYSGPRLSDIGEDLAVTHEWQSEQEWEPSTLLGGCWVHLKNGGQLPPI